MSHCCCNPIPTYNVSNINIDTTTNIATIVVDATAINAGLFNLRFNLCCQKLTSCNSETLKVVVGTTTYANVIQRTGNFATLGQCSRQINCCRILHCNLTSNPSGNVMILDKLPTCRALSIVGKSPTVITENAVTGS